MQIAIFILGVVLFLLNLFYTYDGWVTKAYGQFWASGAVTVLVFLSLLVQALAFPW